MMEIFSNITGFVDNLSLYLESASLFAYVVVFVAGLITSFEPCIYTMIPITVAFIGSKAGGSKLKGFFLSIIYVLGIAVMYSSLGAVAALTGTLFGRISVNPYANLVVGSICFLLGLSMFGLFTIKTPSFLMKYVPKKGKGFGTIFFLGIISGLVAGPCTAAALGAILTYVAHRQNVLFGVSLLFTFSIGMGVLLIIVGTFAGLLLALPKPGKWMEYFKKGMGVFLLALGLYFIIKGIRLF